MNRLLKIIVIILLVLFAVLAITHIGASLLFRTAFPDANGTLNAPGLQEEVTIHRDEMGIPHIYANNSHDLFFAQGYVHAQDRFWQMEWWRHQSQGRLSEIVGDSTLEIDKFLRNTGFNRAAAAHLDYYQSEEPEVWAMLQAYSAGVNAWLAENEDNVSINQTILNLNGSEWEIEPWEPLDTVSWAVAMAWSLRGSGDMFDEMERMVLEEELGADVVAELLPLYPFENRPVIAPTSLHTNQSSGALLVGDTAVSTTPSTLTGNLIGQRPPRWFGLGQGTHVGSNSWVVNGEHTASGLPLMANDPHLEIQMPSIWYEIGLHAPGWDVTGFTLPTFPGVVIGHNDKIAWGFTNVGGDVQDLYIERINPENSLQYEYNGEWRDMEIIEEVIKVNGGDDVVVQVRQTHHGPILNDVQEGIDEALSLRWTVAEDSHVFKALLLLNTAQNYDDFRAAANNFDVPPQNMIYADIAGNIAYQTPGLYPIRSHDGLRPMPGWTDEYEWQGFIPFAEMPAMFNPPSGIIVTANNAVTDLDYPYNIAYYWDNGDRAQRIEDMMTERLTANGQVTAVDYAEMQFDSYSLLAEIYVPLLTQLTSDDPQIQDALAELAAWDYQERRDSSATSIFELFVWHLVPTTLADELAPVQDAFPWYSDAQQVFFYQIANEANSPWWDDVTTTAVEDRDDILLQALNDSVAWLTEAKGSRMSNWQWGDLHTATFQSLPLGQSGISLIEELVNRGPFPSDGGNNIVNATSWDTEAPAHITWLPSMRMIVDLSDLAASQSIHTTGQSGHPGHPHYEDMIPLWLNGEYHPMLWHAADIEANAAETLTLQP